MLLSTPNHDQNILTFEFHQLMLLDLKNKNYNFNVNQIYIHHTSFCQLSFITRIWHSHNIKENKFHLWFLLFVLQFYYCTHAWFLLLSFCSDVHEFLYFLFFKTVLKLNPLAAVPVTKMVHFFIVCTFLPRTRYLVLKNVNILAKNWLNDKKEVMFI